jgi:hypothetical protein
MFNFKFQIAPSYFQPPFEIFTPFISSNGEQLGEKKTP